MFRDRTYQRAPGNLSRAELCVHRHGIRSQRTVSQPAAGCHPLHRAQRIRRELRKETPPMTRRQTFSLEILGAGYLPSATSKEFGSRQLASPRQLPGRFVTPTAPDPSLYFYEQNEGGNKRPHARGISMRPGLNVARLQCHRVPSSTLWPECRM